MIESVNKIKKDISKAHGVTPDEGESVEDFFDKVGKFFEKAGEEIEEFVKDPMGKLKEWLKGIILPILIAIVGIIIVITLKCFCANTSILQKLMGVNQVVKIGNIKVEINPTKWDTVTKTNMIATLITTITVAVIMFEGIIPWAIILVYFTSFYSFYCYFLTFFILLIVIKIIK